MPYFIKINLKTFAIKRNSCNAKNFQITLSLRMQLIAKQYVFDSYFLFTYIPTDKNRRKNCGHRFLVLLACKCLRKFIVIIQFLASFQHLLKISKFLRKRSGFFEKQSFMSNDCCHSVSLVSSDIIKKNADALPICLITCRVLQKAERSQYFLNINSIGQGEYEQLYRFQFKVVLFLKHSICMTCN